ncbi:hypothetical protein [Pedobacter sp.]|uniref:hypothetical protein n=1 Tax=Pedobacter sp. TaxID=1411316 RepID=UPI003BAB1605
MGIGDYSFGEYICIPLLLSASLEVVKYFMGKFSFFIVAFLLTVFLANADTGCLTTDGRVFTNRNGLYLFFWPRYTFTNSTHWRSFSSVYCVEESNDDCRVDSSVSGYADRWGKTITFTIIPCPLDDYIVWFILPIGIVSFLYLRRNQTNNQMNVG